MTAYRRRLGPDLAGAEHDPLRDVDEEIEAHLAMRTDALIEQGMAPDAARAEAERRFGDRAYARMRLTARARGTERRRRWREVWAACVEDVRLALRRARGAPGFTTTALLIFAIGVGLTTAVVSVADQVLLRPLPFPGAERLVALWSVGEDGGDFPWVSMSNWVDWKEGAVTLESAALYATREISIATASGALRAQGTEAGGAFFATVRPRFLQGRGFTEEEAQAGAPVAVVSERLWERGLATGGAEGPARLMLDGRQVDVVGVLRDGQGLPETTEVWMPMSYRAGSGALRNNINYRAVARLAPAATLEQARSELDGIARRIRESDVEALYSWGVGVKPLQSVVVGDARGHITFLTVAVALLLVLACANLAGLSLARARRRSHEVAVRQALGAGRRRILRQAIVDHLVLAILGGGVGVLLGGAAARTVAGRMAAWIPRASEITFDARVAALGFTAAVLAGVLAGLIPALQQSRRGPGAVLAGPRGAVQGGRGLPGAAMVTGEVALALAILIAGGLLLRSYQALVDRELGFEPGGVVAAEITLVDVRYEDVRARSAFWTGLDAMLTEVPGVVAASVASAIPTSDGSRGFIDLPEAIDQNIGAGYFVVGRGYFDALRVPVVAGRTFDASDGPGTERVTVVNEAMAEEFWGGRDPIGERVRARSMEGFGGEAPWLTVVGVVGDMRQYGFEAVPEADMFVLNEQVPFYNRSMTLIVRGADLGALAPAVREAVRGLDPGIPVEPRTLIDRLEEGTASRRAMLSGLAIFAAVALFLVCLGIYGLISFAAEERTREMAVRRALGAERTGVFALMLGGALRVVLIGAAAGALGGWLLSAMLRSYLIDVLPLDPTTYLSAGALLTIVGILAAVVPSVRAARQDPLVVLRGTTS